MFRPDGNMGLDYLLVVLVAACVGVAAAALAYVFPTATIVLAVVTGVLVPRELLHLAPNLLGYREVGGLLLRHSDPILFGVLVAVALGMYTKRRSWTRFLTSYPAFGFLFLVFAIQVARGALSGETASTFGEWRTYYGHFLLVPYIAIFFHSRQKQRELFLVLMLFGVVFLVSALLQGWFLAGFSYQPAMRWLTAPSNLVLLNTLVALMISVRHRLLPFSPSRANLLIAGFVFVTLLNSHRSVWLASLASVALLVLLRQVPLAQQVRVAVLSLLAVGVVAIALYGDDQDLPAFVQTRSLAFTSFEEDSTARWRYHLWAEAVSRIRSQPIWGLGLGSHFQLVGIAGDAITTSPHNAYITLAFHAGLVGLGMYLWFFAQLVLGFAASLRRASDPQDTVIVLTALVVLIASHVFYVAFRLDLFSWLFIGLGVAVSTSEKRRRQMWN